MNETVSKDYESDDDDPGIGAASDPLAEPSGSHGRKSFDPYEGTGDDEPGSSLIRVSRLVRSIMRT